jgi:hypothetical protein
MLLSAVSVLVVTQPSLEVLEGLVNYLYVIVEGNLVVKMFFIL